MHLQTFSTLLASFSLVTQAFVIPADTPNGVYSVSRSEDGTEVHTLLQSKSDTSGEPATSPRDVNVLEKRLRNLWCGCGFTMNHANTDAAVVDIKKQLDNGDVPPHLAFYAIKGKGDQRVVAFACNRSKYSYDFGSDIYGDALREINGQCGRYIAGAARVTNPKGPGQYAFLGYQRYSSEDGGDRFCQEATTSPASSCPH